LPRGATVILISSGAAFAGSPLTGGYAGAKRTQVFMANYSQKESDRLKLGLHFMTLAPRIVTDTELGSMRSPAIAVISAYPRTTSFRAWFGRIRTIPSGASLGAHKPGV
jgi:hypothetical protein